MSKEINPDEKCILVVSPDVSEIIKEKDAEARNVLVTCEFAPAGTAMIVRAEDWERMVDNGIVYERKTQE